MSGMLRVTPRGWAVMTDLCCSTEVAQQPRERGQQQPCEAPKVPGPAPGEVSPYAPVRPGLSSWRAAKDLGRWVDTRLTRSQQRSLGAEETSNVQSMASRSRVVIRALCPALVGPTWSSGAKARLPRTREMWTQWREPSREP